MTEEGIGQKYDKLTEWLLRLEQHFVERYSPAGVSSYTLLATHSLHFGKRGSDWCLTMTPHALSDNTGSRHHIRIDGMSIDLRLQIPRALRALRAGLDNQVEARARRADEAIFEAAQLLSEWVPGFFLDEGPK